MRHVQFLALAAIMFVSSVVLGQETSKNSGKSGGRDALEKQLYEITQHWLESARSKKVDDLKQLFPDQFFEVSSQGVFTPKEDLLQRITTTSQAAYTNNFKLLAVYGTVAITTEDTTMKNTNPNEVTREYRHLRVFVKENGKWRPAAASAVPTVLR